MSTYASVLASCSACACGPMCVVSSSGGPPRTPDKFVDGPVINRALDQHAGSECTALTTQRPGRPRGGVHCLIEIGIRKDNVGGLAAELEGESLQRIGARMQNGLRGAALARERNLVDVRMPNEMLAGAVLPESGNDIDHAGGKARQLEQLAQLQGGDRSLLRGLQNDRASGGE